MKKLVLLGCAISAMAIAAPAGAQTVASGTVDVTGSVAAKCTTASAISGTITLGELALSNGTIDSAFTSNTGGLSRSFTVRCTSGNVQIGVQADPLREASDDTTANGYTGTAHYTATLVAAKAGSGTATAAYSTLAGGAASTQALGGRMANSTDNLTVTVSNGQTSNTGDLLKSGSYAGKIYITVSPV